MAEEGHDNVSNFDLAFGLERSEGKNQNKPKSKPTNENNDSAGKEWSSKKRRFAVVESKVLREHTTVATKNGFRWLRFQYHEYLSFNI